MGDNDDRYVIGLETEEEIDWLARNRDEESESDDSDESKDSEQA